LLVGRDEGLAGLYFEDHRGIDAVVRGRDARGSELDEVCRQLDAYFAGRRVRFELALCPTGTPFQRGVWAALVRIPVGATTTYGALAASIGRPGAARAVGSANARNPISIVVPCHRVLGPRGRLTGYAGGLPRKQALLALERAHAPSRGTVAAGP
jgi:methylated-DNA-[protein]-cysteine S-methyltransferase